ncbi:unnamed protein product [Mytilus coruscus]|uniref:Uncharacterized protein n=1 Tax=Mytilus coruscus TaxID=42192 RepID=A0A6J8BRN6_MYTCO|nr:unnamed protein product [Mytilus coruscus]
MKELYDQTKERLKTIEDYLKPNVKIHTIWECEFDQQKYPEVDPHLKPIDKRDAFYGGRTETIQLYNNLSDLKDTFMKYKQEASGCKCDPKYCKPDCENDKECKTKIQYIIDNAAYNLDIDKIFYKKEFYTWIQILVFTMMMVLKHVKKVENMMGSKLGDLTDEIVSKHNANHIKQFISAGPKDYSMKLDTEKLVSCCKGFRLNAEVEEKITLDKK